ncbi:MAG: hypothetical protein JWP87_412 [Labilithrix sp.]|nr:hypothetical protein [Labilithrix sp.]
MTRAGVTFPKLPQPVLPSDAFVAPATLDASRGNEAVARAVKAGILKPSDIEGAELGEAALLYVPFWRVAVTVDGFHIGLSSMQGRSGRSIPIPTGGARHKDGIVMVCARTIVPYEPKLPSFFGKIAGAPALEIGTDELIALENAGDVLEAGEVVDADVDKARAEAIASGMLLRAVSPTHAIYAKYEPKIHASTFCFYPLYYARYRYEGEARRHAGEEYFVAVSARTGEVVAAKHPSAVRAMTNKLRKLLSFDRR